jgi:hypothetical protein
MRSPASSSVLAEVALQVQQAATADVAQLVVLGAGESRPALNASTS